MRLCFNAYTAMQQDDLDTAALELQKVYVEYTVRFCKGDLTVLSAERPV